MSSLDWRAHRHFDAGGDRPCCLCGIPTPLRSHRGEPVHKVCAEAWNDTTPTAPRHIRDGYDRGTERFHE
ncbi:hypothetical protein [Streptomyces sp. NPDC004682]